MPNFNNRLLFVLSHLSYLYCYFCAVLSFVRGPSTGLGGLVSKATTVKAWSLRILPLIKLVLTTTDISPEVDGLDWEVSVSWQTYSKNPQNQIYKDVNLINKYDKSIFDQIGRWICNTRRRVCILRQEINLILLRNRA